MKQTDGEAQVMLKLWGMGSTSSLPSLPGPLRPGAVTPDRVPSMDQIEQCLRCIELFDYLVSKQMTDV